MTGTNTRGLKRNGRSSTEADALYPANEADPLAELRSRRIGLALAGGGVLAAAHVGVLAALQEAGLTVSAVSGVSAGALVGTLWASGLEIEQLQKMTTVFGFRDLDLQARALLLPWLAHRRPGLIRGDRLEKRLGRLVPISDLSEAVRPCAIVTTDLAQFTPVIFASQAKAVENRPVTVGGRTARYVVGGPVPRILRASMAVPFLFAPVAHGDRLLVDGGIAELVPTDVVRALGTDYVIGVDLTPRPEDVGDVQRLSPIDAFSLSFRYLQDSVPALKPDLTIRPEFKSRVAILDFRRQEACMQAGYDAAYATLKSLAIPGAALCTPALPPVTARHLQTAKPGA